MRVFFLLRCQKDGHKVTVQKRVSVNLAYARDQIFYNLGTLTFLCFVSFAVIASAIAYRTVTLSKE